VTLDVTVIIPTILGREPLLARAVASVAAQSLRPAAVLTLTDTVGWGAAATRDRILADVTTTWVAPLDDDDEWAPGHLAGLAACVEETGADLAFSWYEIVGPTGLVEQWRDPHAAIEGMPWDPAHPRQVPTTFLARTDVLRRAGGWTNGGAWDPDTATTDEQGNRVGEDTLLAWRVNATGARIVHHPARTLRWHHHNDCGGNTSGMPR
jgi:glycosyltransferase involved in cell wall biosynthesis